MFHWPRQNLKHVSHLVASKWHWLCRYQLVFDTLTVRLLFLLWIVLLIPMIALLLFVSQLMSRVLNTHLHEQAQSSLAQLQATWHLSQVLLINLTTDDLPLTDHPSLAEIEQRCGQLPDLLCGALHHDQWQPLTPHTRQRLAAAPPFDRDWLLHWRSQQAFGGRRKPFLQTLSDGQLILWQPVPLAWLDTTDWLMIGRPILPLLRSQIDALILPPGSVVSLTSGDADSPPLLQLQYDPVKRFVPLPRVQGQDALKENHVVKALTLTDAIAPTQTTLTVGIPLQTANQTLQAFFIGGYSIFFIGLVCSMGMAFLASRSVIQPLYQVIEQMDGASNNLLTLKEKPAEISVHGVHEVTRLARGFSRLFSRLAEEYQVRDEFVATLTHDLKVPLLAERQTLDYLGQSLFGPVSGQQQDVIKALIQSNHDVLRLVNSLLEVYRYDTAQVQLRQAPVAMGQLVDTVLATVNSLITEKQLTLARDLDAGAPAYVDTPEMKRVVQNLLANAIAYTPRLGTLRIRLISGDSLGPEFLTRLTDLELSTLKRPIRLKGVTILSIQDGGIGFDRKQLETVFQRFSSKRSHHPMSLGLGLYHSWQVVTAHGGLIWIESTEGVGSAVNLLLPATVETLKHGERYYDRRGSHNSAGGR